MVASDPGSDSRNHAHGYNADAQLARLFCLPRGLSGVRPPVLWNVRLAVLRVHPWHCGDLLLRHSVILRGPAGQRDVALRLWVQMDGRAKPPPGVLWDHHARHHGVLRLLVLAVGIHVDPPLEVQVAVYDKEYPRATGPDRYFWIHRRQERWLG